MAATPEIAITPNVTMFSESALDTSGSSRQRWIIGLMCASIILSAVVIGTDASINLDMSWKASPGPAGLCIIHHITILILSYKERKSQRIDRARALPAVAKLGTVTCIWLLFLLWALVLGFAASAFQKEKANHYIPDKDTPKYPIVLSFIVVEYVVVVTITTLMTLERSVLLCRQKNSVIVES